MPFSLYLKIGVEVLILIVLIIAYAPFNKNDFKGSNSFWLILLLAFVTVGLISAGALLWVVLTEYGF